MELISHLVPNPSRSRRRVRARSVVVTVGTVSSLLLSAAGFVGAAPPPRQPAFTNAIRPSVSASGNVVVFEATTSDGDQSVYSLDVNTRAVTELSVRPVGRRRGDTVHPELSDNGCVVVVTTEVAFDLFLDDDGGDRWDTYRLVMPRCGGDPTDWELVSTNRDGTATDAVAARSRAAVSGSGSIVAYTASQSAGRADVTSLHVVDLTVPISDEHRTTSLATPPSPPQAAVGGPRGAAEPSISDDGTVVAFSADYDASGVTPAWFPVDPLNSTVARQAFVWNPSSGSTSLIANGDGSPPLAGTQRPRLSGDGRYLFVESGEPAWVGQTESTCDGACVRQVFRVELSATTANDGSKPTGTITIGKPLLVSGRAAQSGGPTTQPGNRASYLVDVNTNGNQVVFATTSTNLTDWGLLGSDAQATLTADVVRTFIADVTTPGDRSAGRQALRPIAPTQPATSSDVIASSVRLSGDGNTAIFATRSRTPDPLTTNAGSTIGTHITAPTVVMPALNFGSSTVGAESGELFTTVQNLGPGSFAPTEVRSESEVFKISGGTCTTAVVVAIGDSCSVRVTFSPTESAEYTGQISITDAAGRSITAALAGVGGQPALRIDPGGLDLGVVGVGTKSASSEVKVVNIGFEPVEIDGLGFTDSNRDEFTIVSDECTGTRVQSQQSCAISVAFAPKAAGLRAASLLATTSDGSRSSAVVGGWGTYQPVVTVSKTIVRPNDVVEVVGGGFPAEEPVRIIVSGALTKPIRVTSDASGSFTVPIAVSANALAGSTIVTALAGSGTFASTSLEIGKLAPSVAFVPDHRVA